MSRKHFNDGDDNDSPRFIPVGKEPVDFISVGQEDKYVKDAHVDWWKKEDWKKMKIK